MNNISFDEFNQENDKTHEMYNMGMEKHAEKQEHKKELEKLSSDIISVGKVVSDAIDSKSNKVEVSNFPKSFSTPDIEKVVVELKTLRDKLLEKDSTDYKSQELLQNLIEAVNAVSMTVVNEKQEFPTELSINNQIDYSDKLKAVVDAVNNIKTEFKPNINVKPTDVVVNNDYSKLEDKIDILTGAVKAISIVIPEKDDSKVLKALEKVSKSINSLTFPVPNYVLPFKSTSGAATQAQLDDNGSINSNVVSSVLPTGAATSAKQDDQITLATALNVLTDTLQKTVLSSDKTFLMLQGIRDAIAMPVDYDEPTNAKRILAAGGTIGTVTTVTTVSTLSNQTNIGGSSADMMVENTSYQDWGLSIRSNLI